jgi:hypothetical protein
MTDHRIQEIEYRIKIAETKLQRALIEDAESDMLRTIRNTINSLKALKEQLSKNFIQ